MKKFCVEHSGSIRMGTILLLTASAMGISGCVSSPTYGTGKPASEQLLEDVTGVLQVGPKNKEQIDYKPRPELIKPAETSALPEPQENVLASSDGVWPESPEEQRARLRAEATENRDNLGWRPKIKGPENAETVSAAQYDRNPTKVMDNMSAGTDEASRRRALANPPERSRATLDRGGAIGAVSEDPARQREEFNRRLAANRQGDPGARKYLSEPPLEYRAPSETAPVNDVGEDEDKKEARRKAESRKKAGKRSWKDFVPWI